MEREREEIEAILESKGSDSCKAKKLKCMLIYRYTPLYIGVYLCLKF